MSERAQNHSRHSSLAPLTPVSSGVLQRKCASCGNHTVAGEECTKCGKTKRTLQRKPSRSQGFRMDEDQVPPIVHEALRSPAQPLDPATRAFMERRFGHDFSQVLSLERLHEKNRCLDRMQCVQPRGSMFDLDHP